MRGLIEITTTEDSSDEDDDDSDDSGGVRPERGRHLRCPYCNQDCGIINPREEDFALNTDLMEAIKVR